MTSLKNKWVKNYVIVLMIISVFILASYITIVKKDLYNSVFNNLRGRLEVSTDFYSLYSKAELKMNESLANKIVDEFNFKDRITIQVIDLNGGIVATSSIINSQTSVKSSDYIEALNSQLGYNVYENKETGEKIMAISSPIYSNENMLGVIRYTTSLEMIDEVIFDEAKFAFGVLFIVILLLFIISYLFTRTIINPIEEMIENAKQMAQGDFSNKIEIDTNDEIGELGETLNFMASEIEKSQKIKNEFVSTMTHDIKTPLTAIRGWTELALSSEKVDKTHAIKIIDKETARLQKLVEELLDFSRYDSNNVELKTSKIFASSLIEDVRKVFAAKIKKENIEIKVYHTVDFEITCDEDKIKQVLVNIVDNSIKYSKENLSISIESYTEKNKKVIEITDNGIGISAENIKKVQNKFYSENRIKGGSGLGLAISKEIMDLHGGYLTIESKKDLFTKVILVFVEK